MDLNKQELSDIRDRLKDVSFYLERTIAEADSLSTEDLLGMLQMVLTGIGACWFDLTQLLGEEPRKPNEREIGEIRGGVKSA